MTAAPARHDIVMEQLKRRLGRIAEVLPPARPVVYLDYPVHDNVGDLLIHRGADAFLEDYGYDVRGRFSIHDFSRRGGAGESSIVLKPSIRTLDALLAQGCALMLHGGGNFGDIWPEFQTFRELLVQRYPDTRIVVLPQSIHFGAAAERARAAAIFGAHRKLFFFVRDAESLRFVEDELSGEAEILPDMAHQLWGRPEFAAASAERGTLVLRRRDRESRAASRGDTVHFDWADLNGRASKFALRALRKWQVIDNPLRHIVPNYVLWRLYRDWLVGRAVAAFRPYRQIDTDRLHGLILAALMSKQVRYGDGTYGKLDRYVRLWLAESPLIEAEAAQQAAE
jgi:pyruvyl transferase EpsO